jgi:hypothetical protein
LSQTGNDFLPCLHAFPILERCAHYLFAIVAVLCLSLPLHTSFQFVRLPPQSFCICVSSFTAFFGISAFVCLSLDISFQVFISVSLISGPVSLTPGFPSLSQPIKVVDPLPPATTTTTPIPLSSSYLWLYVSLLLSLLPVVVFSV